MTQNIYKKYSSWVYNPTPDFSLKTRKSVFYLTNIYHSFCIF